MLRPTPAAVSLPTWCLLLVQEVAAGAAATARHAAAAPAARPPDAATTPPARRAGATTPAGTTPPPALPHPATAPSLPAGAPCPGGAPRPPGEHPRTAAHPPGIEASRLGQEAPHPLSAAVQPKPGARWCRPDLGGHLLVLGGRCPSTASTAVGWCMQIAGWALCASLQLNSTNRVLPLLCRHLLFMVGFAIILDPMLQVAAMCR